MNVAIIGFGREGKSSYEYCKKQGFNITICDNNIDAKLPNDCAKKFGKGYLEDLSDFDLIFRSASIKPESIAQANPNYPNILKKVTSNTNEFFKVCPTNNIIGVTGTKGKSTTSTLIAKLLEANSLRAHLGGNIGIPPLELLKKNIKPSDWVILELSSFQLCDLRYSPHIGVMLMMAEEHLDWHNDFDDYFNAKSSLFSRQTKDDIAVYYCSNEYSKKCAKNSPGRKVPYGQKPGAYVENDTITIAGTKICTLNEVALLGSHNIQNICAALTAVWQIQQNPDAMKNVITTFSGLPFRLELRKSFNGVSYYNDSYASNPTSTIAAIKTIKQPKILIIGGKDRGLDLTKLTDAIANDDSTNKVLIIGQAAPRIAKSLKSANYTNFEILTNNSMSEIVKYATSLASEGDAVLLSPGFPSFDMFRDFEDRGLQFNEAVQNL